MIEILEIFAERAWSSDQEWYDGQVQRAFKDPHKLADDWLAMTPKQRLARSPEYEAMLQAERAKFTIIRTPKGPRHRKSWTWSHRKSWFLNNPTRYRARVEKQNRKDREKRLQIRLEEFVREAGMMARGRDQVCTNAIDAMMWVVGPQEHPEVQKDFIYFLCAKPRNLSRKRVAASLGVTEDYVTSVLVERGL